MEMLAADVRLILTAFDALDAACSKLEGHAYEVYLVVKNECGDEYRIGYGENAEPALLSIVDAAPTPGSPE